MVAVINLSIGLGLIVSLAFSELLGLTAGGLVVPGYMALFLNQPIAITMTIVIGATTYFLVNSLSTIMLLYGRRRTALMIIIGFVLGGVLNNFGAIPAPNTSIDLEVVGHIIPGLIAIWIDRQGFLESISTLVIAGVIVRILLILLVGEIAI